MDVRFRAKKIFGNMDSYVQQHEIGAKLGSYVASLASNALGVYVNDLQYGDLVSLNEEGVAVFKNGSLDEILYSDILKVKAPPQRCANWRHSHLERWFCEVCSDCEWPWSTSRRL